MASTISASVVLCSKSPKSHLSTALPRLGLTFFSPWNGLRHLGISLRQKSVKTERKGRCRGKVVYASLFGVGAPEALVIGVVALLVFGPKGLAEVARNLGKTLRAFQPTIKELQEVSRDFKSTLEREIGLDEISPSTQNTYSSTTSSSSSNSEDSEAMVNPNVNPSSEEYLKTTEEQLKSYATQQQTPSQEDQSESQPQPQDDDPSLNKSFNLGEFLLEAKVKTSTSQQQEQTPPPQQDLSEPQSQQPQAVASEIVTSTSPSNKPESEMKPLQ